MIFFFNIIVIILLINICSATNSGKTTLVTKLEQTFQSSAVINQDLFFRVMFIFTTNNNNNNNNNYYYYYLSSFFQPEDDPNHVWVDLIPTRKHQNWEHLDCINWDNMCDRIRQVLSQRTTVPEGKAKSFLFLDGHIILNYRLVSKIKNSKSDYNSQYSCFTTTINTVSKQIKQLGQFPIFVI